MARGSIQRRERADGKPSWRARYRDDQGKWRTKTFRKKADAEEWLRRHVGGSDDPDDLDTPYSVAVEEWLARRVNLSRSTRSTDDWIVERFILPQWGEAIISKVRPRHVRQWLADLPDDLSQSSVSKVWQRFSAISRLAVSEGYTLRDPVAGLKLSEIRETPDEAPARLLTPAEVAGIVEAVEPWWRPFTWTLYLTGARIGELAALDVSDYTGQTISITKTLTEGRGGAQIGPPKTKHSIRTVTLPPAASLVIEDHLALRGNPSDGPLFVTPRGARVTLVNYRARVWAPAVEKFFFPVSDDLPTPHDLRHAHASNLIAAGASPVAIAKRLGHKDATVTLKVYSHAFPAQEEALAGTFAETLAVSGVTIRRPSEALKP